MVNSSHQFTPASIYTSILKFQLSPVARDRSSGETWKIKHDRYCAVHSILFYCRLYSKRLEATTWAWDEAFQWRSNWKRSGSWSSSQKKSGAEEKLNVIKASGLWLHMVRRKSCTGMVGEHVNSIVIWWRMLLRRSRDTENGRNNSGQRSLHIMVSTEY